MAVAIKRKNNDLIFIDAVLQYTRQYSSSVSKNPIENGSSVTDHVTLENTVLTVNGVVSDADFNIDRPLITPDDAQYFEIANRNFLNNNPIIGSPIIGGPNSKPSFIPEIVNQFLNDNPPTITYVDDEDRGGVLTRISTSIELDLLNIYETKEEITLLDFDGDRIVKAYFNCILTSLNFEESPDSGQALYPRMTFEQITKVSLKTTTIPPNVAAAMKPKTAPTDKKGKQNPTKGESETTQGDNAASEPTSNSGDTTRRSVTLEATEGSPAEKVKETAKSDGSFFQLGGSL